VSEPGAVRKDLLVRQGQTFQFVLTVLNPDGTNFNLNGFSARMQVRPSTGSSIKYWDLSSPMSIQVVPASAQVAVTVGSDVTAAIAWIGGVYDLEIFDASSPPIVWKLAYGVVKVQPEVTK